MTENPYKALELTQILGQPCEFQVIPGTGHFTPCNTTSSIACCASNPAPLVLPDGRMIVMANGDCKTGQKLPKASHVEYQRGCFTPYVADSWDKPYLSQLTHENGLASIPTRTSWSSTPVKLPHDGCFAALLGVSRFETRLVRKFACLHRTKVDLGPHRLFG